MIQSLQVESSVLPFLLLPQLRKHYKEYLIFKVNEALVDPADDMNVAELGAVLMREEKEVPKGDEKDPQYKERLKEVSCRCWCGVEEGQCVCRWHHCQ